MKANRCIREWNGTPLEIRPMCALDLHRHEIWVSPTDVDVVYFTTASNIKPVQFRVNEASYDIYLSGKEL